MISITSKALAKLQDMSNELGVGHLKVRLRVIGGGCHGFSYDMCFEEVSSEMDEVSLIDGVTIIVDPLSIQYIDGTEIDFEDGLFASGFKFNNPNITGTCGCTKSFSF